VIPDFPGKLLGEKYSIVEPLGAIPSHDESGDRGVLAMLVREERLSETTQDMLLSWEHSGFVRKEFPVRGPGGARQGSA
jgi:hypothetical protein